MFRSFISGVLMAALGSGSAFANSAGALSEAISVARQTDPANTFDPSVFAGKLLAMDSNLETVDETVDEGPALLEETSQPSPDSVNVSGEQAVPESGTVMDTMATPKEPEAPTAAEPASNFSEEMPESKPVVNPPVTNYSSTLSSGGRRYEPEFLEKRLNRFKGMKGAGILFSILGPIMVVGGFVAFVNAEDGPQDPYNPNQTTKEGPGAFFGVLGIGLGIPVSVLGFILAGIGSKKVRYYEGLLDESRHGMPKLEMNSKELKLSWDF